MDAPGDAGQRRAGCATTSATRLVEPEAGPLASGQSGVGRLAELPRIVEAVVAAVGDRPVRAPDAAARPPLVAPRARARPDRPARRRQRRAARARRSTRSASSATARPGGWAWPSPPPRSTAARGSRSSRPTSRSRRRPGATVVRGRVDRRAADRAPPADPRRGRRAPASTPWSWPPRSPTSGRPTPPTTSSSAAAGLTLELEPTPDVLGQIARLVRGTDRPAR